MNVQPIVEKRLFCSLAIFRKLSTRESASLFCDDEQGDLFLFLTREKVKEGFGKQMKVNGPDR